MVTFAAHLTSSRSIYVQDSWSLCINDNLLTNRLTEKRETAFIEDLDGYSGANVLRLEAV